MITVVVGDVELFGTTTLTVRAPVNLPKGLVQLNKVKVLMCWIEIEEEFFKSLVNLTRLYLSIVKTRVELLPSFKFTGKTVKNTKFTDNYR